MYHQHIYFTTYRGRSQVFLRQLLTVKHVPHLSSSDNFPQAAKKKSAHAFLYQSLQVHAANIPTTSREQLDRSSMIQKCPTLDLVPRHHIFRARPVALSKIGLDTFTGKTVPAGYRARVKVALRHTSFYHQ